MPKKKPKQKNRQKEELIQDIAAGKITPKLCAKILSTIECWDRKDPKNYEESWTFTSSLFNALSKLSTELSEDLSITLFVAIAHLKELLLQGFLVSARYMAMEKIYRDREFNIASEVAKFIGPIKSLVNDIKETAPFDEMLKDFEKFFSILIKNKKALQEDLSDAAFEDLKSFLKDLRGKFSYENQEKLQRLWSELDAAFQDSPSQKEVEHGMAIDGVGVDESIEAGSGEVGIEAFSAPPFPAPASPPAEAPRPRPSAVLFAPPPPPPTMTASLSLPQRPRPRLPAYGGVVPHPLGEMLAQRIAAQRRKRTDPEPTSEPENDKAVSAAQPKSEAQKLSETDISQSSDDVKRAIVKYEKTDEGQQETLVDLEKRVSADNYPPYQMGIRIIENKGLAYFLGVLIRLTQAPFVRSRGMVGTGVWDLPNESEPKRYRSYQTYCFLFKHLLDLASRTISSSKYTAVIAGQLFKFVDRIKEMISVHDGSDRFMSSSDAFRILHSLVSQDVFQAENEAPGPAPTTPSTAPELSFVSEVSPEEHIKARLKEHVSNFKNGRLKLKLKLKSFEVYLTDAELKGVGNLSEFTFEASEKTGTKLEEALKADWRSEQPKVFRIFKERNLSYILGFAIAFAAPYDEGKNQEEHKKSYLYVMILKTILTEAWKLALTHYKENKAEIKELIKEIFSIALSTHKNTKREEAYQSFFKRMRGKTLPPLSLKDFQHYYYGSGSKNGKRKRDGGESLPPPPPEGVAISAASLPSGPPAAPAASGALESRRPPDLSRLFASITDFVGALNEEASSVPSAPRPGFP